MNPQEKELQEYLSQNKYPIENQYENNEYLPQELSYYFWFEKPFCPSCQGELFFPEYGEEQHKNPPEPKCVHCGKEVPYFSEMKKFVKEYYDKFKNNHIYKCKVCGTKYPPVEFIDGKPINLPKCSFCGKEMSPPKDGSRCSSVSNNSSSSSNSNRSNDSNNNKNNSSNSSKSNNSYHCHCPNCLKHKIEIDTDDSNFYNNNNYDNELNISKKKKEKSKKKQKTTNNISVINPFDKEVDSEPEKNYGDYQINMKKNENEIDNYYDNIWNEWYSYYYDYFYPNNNNGEEINQNINFENQNDYCPEYYQENIDYGSQEFIPDFQGQDKEF